MQSMYKRPMKEIKLSVEQEILSIFYLSFMYLGPKGGLVFRSFLKYSIYFSRPGGRVYTSKIDQSCLIIKVQSEKKYNTLCFLAFT